MRHLLGFALSLVIAAPAVAHDFWIQPRSWQASTATPSVFFVEVGHGPFKTKWDSGPDRIGVFREFSRDAVLDLKPSFMPGGITPHLIRQFKTPGLHLLSMATTNASSDLPALRFNDYIKAEGLTLAIADRAAKGTDNKPGRERYSRRTKTMVQIGPVTAQDQKLALQPLGLSLEIVPRRNPYALGRDRRLPVQILFGGKPLAGALVKLTNLQDDANPIAMVRSDARGNAVFIIPNGGSWLVNTIWSRPVASTTEDYETIFSSLTFGWAAGQSR